MEYAVASVHAVHLVFPKGVVGFFGKSGALEPLDEGGSVPRAVFDFKKKLEVEAKTVQPYISLSAEGGSFHNPSYSPISLAGITTVGVVGAVSVGVAVKKALDLYKLSVAIKRTVPGVQRAAFFL